jgi:hypothetical protein
VFPARTTRLRVERHTRAEPYEPADTEVVDELDATIGSITSVGDRDGGRSGRQRLQTTIRLHGAVPAGQGLVLIDRDGTEWTVDSMSTRTVLGNTTTTCEVSSTVGAVTT